MSGNKKNNDEGIGCILTMIVALIAMPLLGLYFIVAGKSSEQRLLGVALLIVGIIVWVKVGMAS